MLWPYFIETKVNVMAYFIETKVNVMAFIETKLPTISRNFPPQYGSHSSLCGGARQNLHDLSACVCTHVFLCVYPAPSCMRGYTKLAETYERPPPCCPAFDARSPLEF